MIGAWRANLIPLLIVIAVAVLCGQLSFRLRAEGIAENYQAEFDILRGRSLHFEFQNRVIAPSMLAALRWLLPEGVPNRSVWYLDRTLQAMLGFTVLYGVCLHLTQRRLASVMAVGLVAFAYVWTAMTHSVELTTDFFDVMFTALIVLCVLEERAVALLFLVAVAALNRESAAFAGVVWLAMALARYGPRIANWRKAVPGFVYMVLAVGVTAGMRWGLSVDPKPGQHLGIRDTLDMIHALLHPTGFAPMLFFTLLVFAVCLARLPRPWSAEQKGLLLAAVICAAISSVFGVISELRVFLPCWVMLAIAIVITPRPQTDKQWLVSLLDRKATGP